MFVLLCVSMRKIWDRSRIWARLWNNLMKDYAFLCEINYVDLNNL